MAEITETARAKINLALHVTGRRDDGYHLLDSLVTFASHGDLLTFEPADEDDFTLTGPYGALLSADTDNLVLKARNRLRQAVEASGQSAPAVSIELTKNLPIASGIGGGSADAAATLRGLMRLWQVMLPDPVLQEIALSLGADVPMCLASRPLIAKGIGEHLQSVALPSLFLVLANPLVAVSTPEVFRRLEKRDNPPMDLDATATLPWTERIARLRNDLEPPARALTPAIAETLQALEQTGATLTRMSGSGATCFGLYVDRNAAAEAAKILSERKPGWYVQATQALAGGSA
ncbi:4-(cytidine 5'-diphospho)-2-C-methyl-D-erythritol kinase [Rhizobium oryzicola]|uniref:4-diphosphocytidyl-2-C-methyl-D-erythritol kinase n=1 Tax=Rhizobium oryzicola TaxID=1232668 RepID=A0ABT8ST44_9HYPH|nr:4-(cytidine 5'-diphospho)-2-C-methyl-D-erythritol kinase [Rhizobium oryzicola]MDO1581208.1 4-(cytidine 5'-diphospho)-2-C-methyl-D-erythritol kinase [Rhizobium oryzicola]